MNQFQKPLKNRKFIITRAQNQISEVKPMFENLGAMIFDLPALVIDYPENTQPLDSALNEINNFHWIIFSSCNGIKFTEKRLLAKGLSLKNLSENVKIAVVGQKTSQYLKKLGIQPSFIPPNFIADSLVKNFPLPLKGLRFFIPRVQSGGRNIIAESFIKAGAYVREVAAYESKCPESIPEETINALHKKIIDAILFSSAKTVENTSFLLKNHFGKEWETLLNEVKLLTIGPQTSAKCREKFGRVDKQANRFTFEGLLEASIQYFS